jgi:hypothetical protein
MSNEVRQLLEFGSFRVDPEQRLLLSPKTLDLLLVLVQHSGQVVLKDEFKENCLSRTIFDVALRQGLSAQLDQSPFLNLLSDSRTGQTLSRKGKANDEPLTPELAREVCQCGSAQRFDCANR